MTRRSILEGLGILFIGFAFAELGSAQPNRVSVYVFSRDSAAGLEDERLDTFRRELGKYADSAMELGYTRGSADVSVQFLGQGTLGVELDRNGRAVRHLWTPDDKASKMWAVLHARKLEDFSKEFSVEGSGGRDLSRLAKRIGDWLERNGSRLRPPVSTPDGVREPRR